MKLYELAATLANPERVKELNEAGWSRLISQAYHTNLLGRLGWVLKHEGLSDSIPEAIQWHFRSALKVSQAHARDMLIEVTKVKQALKQADIYPLFLKGVAYELAADWVREGRVYSDVDLFIPREQIDAAEYILRLHGWQQGAMSAYDREYYRRWMHELPPLVHKGRGATLDVHHNLLPQTCRIRLDASRFDVSEGGRLETLPVEQRILHCVMHLFMEGEFDKGLRDLSDIDLLLRQHCSGDALRWERLNQLAVSMGIQSLWYYALCCCRQILETPVPSEVIANCKKTLAAPLVLRQLTLLLLLTVFRNPPSSAGLNRSGLAHFLLYLRGHWLRMPLKLLIPHLFRKAFKAKNVPETIDPQ